MDEVADPPAYCQTSLSHILSASAASHVLGEGPLRSIVLSFLRCIASQTVQNPVSHRPSAAAASANDGHGSLDIDFRLISDNIFETNETEEERRWADLFTAALLWDFEANKTVPRWCFAAWHRLINITRTESVSPTVSSTSAAVVHSRIAIPLLALDKGTYLRSIFPYPAAPRQGPGGHLVLLECLFYALATPHPTLSPYFSSSSSSLGVGGRAFPKKGVNSKVDQPLSSLQTLNRTLIILPDLIIFWGILQSYHHSFVQGVSTTTGEESKVEHSLIDTVAEDPTEQQLTKGPTRRIYFNKEQKYAFSCMANLVFRVYDGYLKTGVVTRDTLQRFIADIHGEDALKRPFVKKIFDIMFDANYDARVKHGPGGMDPLSSLPSGPSRQLAHLDDVQFTRSIWKTISVNTEDQPVHILFEWLQHLGLTTLPRYLHESRSPQIQRLIQAKVEMMRNYNPDVEMHALGKKFGLICEDSDPAFAKSELLDSPSSASNAFGRSIEIYEVKRRFRSIAEKSMAAKVKAGYMNSSDSDENDDDTSVGFEGEEGHHLPIDENEALSSSSHSLSSNYRNNVILEEAFVSAASSPNEEMGHGGFLSERIARLTFKAGCQAMQRLSIFRKLMTDLAQESSFAEILKRRGASYDSILNGEIHCWTFYDALYFGCIAVRAELLYSGKRNISLEPADSALLEFIYSLFLLLPRSPSDTLSDPHCLSRSQVGQMILLLLEQASFRLQADSSVSRTNAHDYNQSYYVADELEQIMINVSEASILGLLPTNMDFIKTNPSNDAISLDKLINYVFEDSGLDCTADNCLSFDDLMRWYLASSDNIASLPLSQRRLGPLLVDLRIFASIIFGVKPYHPATEKFIIKETMRRHRCRYPQTESSKRGPAGTTWYIIQANWWNRWVNYVDCDVDDAVIPDKLQKIDNSQLLVDHGPIALRSNIRRAEFELVPPLVWSALQGWHDGGPYISRSVVPFPISHGNASSIISRPTHKNVDIELYPLFVTVLLLDATSNGKIRPFQQYFPMSNHLPVLTMLKQLCKSLDIDTKNARIWFLGSRSNFTGTSSEPDWILRLDVGILDQLKERGILTAGDEIGAKTIFLLFEVQDAMTASWPNDKNSASNESLQNKDQADTVSLGDGVVGLYNMGNTCYLNASIQCLSHTPIFRDYFTSKAYLNDINITNPLGYQGKLAQVCGTLIDAIWRQSNRVNASPQEKRLNRPGQYLINTPALTPKSFKEKVSELNEHFAGNEQHDAQELLAFLLSGLSEDLNRIVEKPYIEAPDSDGRPDEDLAEIWWSNHLKREFSLIVSLFAGQYKSLLTCGTCRYESARFEPFAFLQVPLPEDDQITVNLYLYCLNEGPEPFKYSVRTKYNGTLRDLLHALAKIRAGEKEIGEKKNRFLNQGNDAVDGDVFYESKESVLGPNDSDKSASALVDMMSNMAVVKVGEGYIFNVVPETWFLSKLTNRETGELQTLHVYELDTLPHTETSMVPSPNNDTDFIPEENPINPIPLDSTGQIGQLNEELASLTTEDDGNKTSSSDKHAFLALLQRKIEFNKRPFLFPFCQRVFGTPLLLRVPKLERFTGCDIYDLVAQKLRNFVPVSVSQFLIPDAEGDKRMSTTTTSYTKQLRRGSRKHRERSTVDMEETLIGDVSRYGFLLRICCRDGTRCSRCPWFTSCIGCLVADDDFPTNIVTGDSIAIDWQLTVDLSTDSFEEASDGNLAAAWDPASHIRRNRSVKGGKSRAEYRASITLEECLDAFAQKEKIPEAYCSKCKEFRVQTKVMSLWRLPPVMIIHLKRFQFTQQMRRKLRDLVTFPLEGLDFSRITTSDPGLFLKTSRKQRWIDDHIRDHEEEKRNNSYDLYGVIHHQGALSGGHYFASLKSSTDGKWHLFDDAQVYEINSEDVIDSSAYILFYVRRDLKDAKLEDFWKPNSNNHEFVHDASMDNTAKSRSERCVVS